MKTKLFSLFLMLIISTGTMLASTKIGDLYYNLDATHKTAEVTYQVDESYENYYNLKSAIIPASVTYNNKTYSVTSIGSSAFSSCTSLTSIEIPNSVTSIGKKAFCYCHSLSSIEIPSDVTNIKESTFEHCSSLSSVTIPKGVTSIERNAFYYCYSLISVHISDITTWCTIYFANKEANPLCCAHNLYVNSELVTDLIIPDDITFISGYAFNGCSSLTSVNIGDGVTNIGGSAFSDCTGLTSVTIGNNVKTIDGHAFSGCTGLTSLSIGNSVKTIGGFAFQRCSGMTSIEIPNSVTSIGEYAFSGCTGITSVTIPKSVTSIGEGAFITINSLTSVTLNSNAIVSKEYTYTSSIKDIFGNQVLKYVIGEDVTSIGKYAFHSCTSLTSVAIPNSITSIGEYAFSGCSKLTSITCNATTPPSLNAHAFDNCDELKEIIVPCYTRDAYVTAENWSKYADIIPEDEPLQYSVTGIVKDGIGGIVIVPTTVCDSNIMEAIPNYGYHFVQWNDGISDNPRTIELYQDTTFIAEFAVDKSGTCGANNELIWSYEDESKTLTISGSGELTENYTFGIEVPTQMQSLIIGNEVTAIGDSVFYATNTLNHLTIGGNVASIGDYAFAECKNFDDITCYATTVPTISDKTFEDIGNKQYIYLYVPEDRERAYKRDTYWGQFDIQVIGGTKTTTDDLVVESTDNTADIIWPTIPGAETYELVIKDKDGNVVCTLIFNSEGQLVSIIFGAPARGTTSEQAQTEGFSFTVTGLVEGETYDLTITAKDADGNVLDVKSMTFVAGAGTQQGISQTITLTDISTKIFRDGQLLIEKNGKIYNATGAEVK